MCAHRNSMDHNKVLFVHNVHLFPPNAFDSEIGTFSVMTKKEKLYRLYLHVYVYKQLLCVKTRGLHFLSSTLEKKRVIIFSGNRDKKTFPFIYLLTRYPFNLSFLCLV